MLHVNERVLHVSSVVLCYQSVCTSVLCVHTMLSHHKFPISTQMLGTEGKSGFYRGRIACSIVDIVQSNGGMLRLEDLDSHFTTFDDPVKVNYRGIDVWEMPPNGQGLTALMALNILSGYDFSCKSSHVGVT